MELDGYAMGLPLEKTEPVARGVESLGFSGLWFTESSRPPYLGCAVAALATSSIRIGTSIAVAFPRSPMITAQTAWELGRASKGRFVLGLGTQVKAHMERRFSVPFERPGPKLREYVLALRAIWRAFQGEEPLKFEGEFYSFSLLTDFFSPGPSDYPDLPVAIAGVNPWMARLAGEVCDGFHVHPFHSPSYLAGVIRPAIAAGAALAGRAASDIEILCPVFVAVGDTETERESQRQAVRRQIAFYGSTRTYRPVFEHHGWADASEALHRLMAKGDQDAMAEVITDEMLDAYSVSATWDDLGPALVRRYGSLADRVLPYRAVDEWIRDPQLAARWQGVAETVRAG